VNTNDNAVLFVNNKSKSNMTLMFAGSASGVLLPPMFIFKAKDVYEAWTRNAPTDSVFAAAPKGWMTKGLMLDWLIKVAIPYFDDLDNDLPRVLLVDNFQ
jgi:hypothetical protein